MFLCLLFALCLSPGENAPQAMAAQSTGGFGLRAVAERARELASRPYENPEGEVPEFLLKLSYDQWRDIRFRKENALWRDRGLPFEVQFFHPGMFYNRLVRINVVNAEGPSPVPYSRDFFDYGDNEFKEPFPEDLSFAGFRIHFPINRPDYKDEVAVFLGASYFRGVAEGLQYGLSARGLAIDTALSSGEEFPCFREFWLLEPASGDTSLTLYALLDSPSITGAYKFIVTPGEETAMDVDARLFRRANVAKLGIAPLTSMFLFGETENGRPGDYRPEVHDSDVLLLHTGEGEWLWRPLGNNKRLGISSWKAGNLAGFGLLQQDRLFDHYQDLEARYELRPSLWVEAKGKWGPGRVELIEIPSEEEINDNMVAFWVPEPPAPEEGTTDVEEENDPLAFSYRLRWCALPKDLLSLGVPASTRTAKSAPDITKFVLDFEGGELETLSADAGLSSVITVGEGGQLLEKQLHKNDVTGGWRLVFQVRTVPEGKFKAVFPAHRPPIRLSALLKKGENLPDPLTVTWTYDLLQ